MASDLQRQWLEKHKEAVPVAAPPPEEVTQWRVAASPRAPTLPARTDWLMAVSAYALLAVSLGINARNARTPGASAIDNALGIGLGVMVGIIAFLLSPRAWGAVPGASKRGS